MTAFWPQFALPIPSSVASLRHKLSGVRTLKLLPCYVGSCFFEMALKDSVLTWMSGSAIYHSFSAELVYQSSFLL